MGNECIIRPATLADESKLITVKTEYLRSLYSGFVTDELQVKMQSASNSGFYAQLLQNENIRIKVLEEDGEIIGFIVYGPDDENPSCGRIYDAAILPGHDSQRDILLTSTLEKLV